MVPKQVNDHWREPIQVQSMPREQSGEKEVKEKKKKEKKYITRPVFNIGKDLWKTKGDNWSCWGTFAQFKFDFQNI